MDSSASRLSMCCFVSFFPQFSTNETTPPDVACAFCRKNCKMGIEDLSKNSSDAKMRFETTKTYFKSHGKQTDLSNDQTLHHHSFKLNPLKSSYTIVFVSILFSILFESPRCCGVCDLERDLG